LFLPFYRVAEARDRQSGGTGIGLAITDRAVRLHNGSVIARNAIDGGLLIEIRLPVTGVNALSLP
jgi:two-component system sensor histidine kinase CpxA